MFLRPPSPFLSGNVMWATTQHINLLFQLVKLGSPVSLEDRSIFISILEGGQAGMRFEFFKIKDGHVELSSFVNSTLLFKKKKMKQQHPYTTFKFLH